MEVFRTSSTVIVAESRRNFLFSSIKASVVYPHCKVFLQRFSASENILCSLFSSKATSQLNCLFSGYGDKIGSIFQLTNAINKELSKFFADALSVTVHGASRRVSTISKDERNVVSQTLSCATRYRRKKLKSISTSTPMIQNIPFIFGAKRA